MTTTTKPWRHIIGPLSVALTLLMGACSTDDPVSEPEESAPADVSSITQPPETTDPEPTAEPEPEPEPEPEELTTQTSQRGNLIKEIGETAGMFDQAKGPESPWLEFQVTDIEVGGECTEEYAEAPENGEFMFVTISASTSSDWPAELQGTTVDFNPNDFSIVGEDSLTEHEVATFATYGCLPDGELLPPNGIGPGENVVGKLVLDTANASGVLVHRPWFTDSGWEWEY